MFDFEGIAPPLITSFDRKGEIDEGAYRELIDWLIEEAVHGIVATESNREALYLSAAERARLIEIWSRLAVVPLLSLVPGIPTLE